MTPEPRCARCGAPKSDHPYRHPFMQVMDQDDVDEAFDRGVSSERERCAERTEKLEALYRAVDSEWEPGLPVSICKALRAVQLLDEEE